VNHEVHFAPHGGLQCPLEVREKVVSSAPPIDAWVGGQVEAQMGVGDEQYADNFGTHDGRLTPTVAFYAGVELQRRQLALMMHCVS
jgi:hypothetical protein